MPTAASSAGFGSGFRSGLASARERRLDEQERARLKQRQDAADTRAAESHALSTESGRISLDAARRANSPEEIDRRRRLDELQLKGAELNVESGRFGLDQARRGAEISAEDRKRGRMREDFQFDRDQTTAARDDDAYKRVQRQMESEGLPQLFAMLESGVDPDLARERFNQVGGHRLERVDFNRETGMIRLVDDEGEGAEFPLEQWRRAYPTASAEPIKLGKDDRLVTPGGEEIVGPSAGAGSDRDVSPYNPQTVQDDITAGVVRSMGGQFDAYGNYSFGGGSDRALGDYRIALAQNMAGRLEEQVKATRVTPGAIVDAVMDATKGVPSETTLLEEVEAWRTKGTNKDHEDAAREMEARRRQYRAEAEAKLARLEREFIGQTAKREPPPAFEKPDWAGEAIAPDVLGGAELEAGYEYDVEIDGRRTTIRLGPDGAAYEVKGAAGGPIDQPQASVAAPPAEATLASTRGAPDVPRTAPLETQTPDLSLARTRSGRNTATSEPVDVLDTIQTAAGSGRSRSRGRSDRNSIASVAHRVRTALGSERAPIKADIVLLNGQSDEALIQAGFSAQEVAQIRATAHADLSLADAKRNRGEFVY
jgi:hypothetical protein